MLSIIFRLTGRLTVRRAKLQCIALFLTHFSFISILTVCREYEFQDKHLFYRFEVDQQIVDNNNEMDKEERGPFAENDFRDSVLALSMIGPDAMFRMALRKP